MDICKKHQTVVVSV